MQLKGGGSGREADSEQETAKPTEKRGLQDAVYPRGRRRRGADRLGGTDPAPPPAPGSLGQKVCVWCVWGELEGCFGKTELVTGPASLCWRRGRSRKLKGWGLTSPHRKENLITQGKE